MKFIRIGDETINLDLITHVKEGCKEETLYGRSVRKTTDHRFGWLEVHFVSGDILKVEGEESDVLRRILVEATGAREPAPPIPARKPTPRKSLALSPWARARGMTMPRTPRTRQKSTGAASAMVWDDSRDRHRKDRPFVSPLAIQTGGSS